MEIAYPIEDDSSYISIILRINNVPIIQSVWII